MRPLFKNNKRIPTLDPDEILADSLGHARPQISSEGKMDFPLGRFYPVIFSLLIAAGVVYLSWTASHLMLQEGKHFFLKSQENRFLMRPVFPPRGIIYDQFNTPLVSNIPSFGIVFEKDEFIKAGGDMEKLLDNLGVLLDKDQEYFSELGLTADGHIETEVRRAVLAEDIGVEAVVKIASAPDKFPGVQTFETYKRAYRDPFATAHLLGFVGKASPEDLSLHPDIMAGEMLGKNGLEGFYDKMLRGQGGRKIVEVDSYGRETRFKFAENPQEGIKIKLAINGGLERVAYDTVRNYTGGGKGASVVAIDPRNGAIRALVSFPGFDSSHFSNSLSKKEFDAVLKNPLAPLFNRAVGGEFPSGSTIKPLIAAAALQEKIISPEKKIYDEGFIAIPNPYKPGEKSVFVDWKKHGWVDFYDALAYSANVYFYMVGGGYRDQKGLGIERIKKYALAFGLGSKLGIDLTGEKAGFIPDPETKKITEPQDPVWRVGDTYNVSIGQGGVKVTPLQMASLTATLANGGKLWQPYLLDAMLDNQGRVVQKHDPQLIRENMVAEENIREVIKGMRKTVTAGTARLLANLPVAAAAKTGTAQAGSGLPHAWVTAFAPAENPEIAIVVMVEHAGEGATVAVPITNEILKWYFEHR